MADKEETKSDDVVGMTFFQNWVMNEIRLISGNTLSVAKEIPEIKANLNNMAKQHSGLDRRLEAVETTIVKAVPKMEMEVDALKTTSTETATKLAHIEKHLEAQKESDLVRKAAWSGPQKVIAGLIMLIPIAASTRGV